jgi:adenosine deaminase
LRQALPYKGWFVGVDLDSTEAGHPPEEFEAVFDETAKHEFHRVAYAEEEGHPGTSGRPRTYWGQSESTTASGAWRITR